MADSQGEDSYVKLPAIDKQRPLDVPLQDAVTVLALAATVFSRSTILHHMRLYLLKVVKDFDAITTVGRLTWLEDP